MSNHISMSSSATLTYRTVEVDGLNIFYREAGSKAFPTLLLLHGFPSSSRMFNTLMPLLADRYHVVAPDYPGFGHSDAPEPDAFTYSFDRLAGVMDGFVQALGLTRYSLFLQDYGGPVGFRLMLAHPERVQAIVIQNAVAHEEGLGPLWESRKAYWRDRASLEEQVMAAFTSLETARGRHVGTSPHPERFNPDTWTDEFAALSRPGQKRIQGDLFHDYQTNVASYPKWQAWLRENKRPILVVWGRYDSSFTVAGGKAYGRDAPHAEIHILDAGHFALDEKLDEIAALMRAFLGRQALV
jgi:pimeloyl-ACP methyl ester carboxylesterase